MKLMVIDGNSIVNRAYYGIRPLSTRDGLYTHAIYGFLTTLQRLLDEEQPEALCVTFDRREPTFRHQADERYKAQRKGMPEELAMQLPYLKQVLSAMNIPQYDLTGYEADDLIGTISRRCEASGWDCVIVTGDKDSLQLITPHTKVKLVSTRMGQTTTKDMTEETFREQYGFAPIHMIDLKALMGDASDNIPGVPGVGEKTAMALVQQYHSVAELYRLLPEIDAKPGVIKKLQEGRESAEHSRYLATIVTDTPLNFTPEDNLRRPFAPELYDLLLKLEFQKLIDRYGLTPHRDTEAAPEYTVAVEPLETEQQAQALLAQWRQADHVTVYALPSLSVLSVQWDTGAHTSAAAELDQSRYTGDWHALLSALFSADIRKVGHHIKDTMRTLLEQELPTDGYLFDTALAAYLLDATAGSYDLQRLFVTYYNEELPKPLHLEPDAFAPLADTASAWAALHSYCSAVEALYETLPPKLEELGMKELYHTVELPLCPVLARMEQRGFLVDAKALSDFGESLTGTIRRLEQRVYDAAGAPFNINSPKQLGKVLFEDLQLPHGKKTKTGWSTNADVLEKLRYEAPIVGAVLEYRQYAKAPLAAPHCGGRIGIPAVQQAEKHLCRRPAEGHRRRRPHPHQLPDDGNGHRPPVLHGAQPPEHPHPHGAGQPDAPDVRGGAGEPAGGCRLLPDRAAAAGPHLRRRGDAAGLPFRGGLPYPHRLQGVPRTAGGGDSPDALTGQGRELRHRLRHLSLLPVSGHRRHRGRGQGVYGALLRHLYRRPPVYDGGGGAGPAAGLRRHSLRAAAGAAGAEELQLQPPLLRGAGGAEYAHSGYGGGHHEAGHDPGRAAALQRGSGRPAHHAGPR